MANIATKRAVSVRDPDQCNNCVCFRPKNIPAAMLQATEGLGAPGQCLRDPRPVEKFGFGWCLSHKRETE